MTPTTDLTVTIVLNEKGNPPGTLADAERHVRTGRLDGLTLIGVAVWERRGATGDNVTFPSRQYSVNGGGAASRGGGRWSIPRRRPACATSSCRPMPRRTRRPCDRVGGRFTPTSGSSSVAEGQAPCLIRCSVLQTRHASSRDWTRSLDTSSTAKTCPP